MKKIVALLLSLTMIMSLAACGQQTQTTQPAAAEPAATAESTTETEPAAEPLKIGWTLNTMQNPIFAEAGTSFQKKCDELGWEVTILDAQENVATQINQVENLIASDIDALIIYPVEVSALNDVCGEAIKKGIKVFSWDFDMENADMCWLVYNYDLGYMIGSEAAKWANEKYPDGCEVAIIDYAMLPVIVERANGIIDAIKELAPKCTIVAQDSAADVATGMSISESMLQAHPDIRVFASVGDGGAVGANEAIKAAGLNLDDYGCFGADASDEALEAINNNEALRMSVSLGNGEQFAECLVDYVKQLTSGESYNREVYKPMTPVSADNLAEFYKG